MPGEGSAHGVSISASAYWQGSGYQEPSLAGELQDGREHRYYTTPTLNDFVAWRRGGGTQRIISN